MKRIILSVFVMFLGVTGIIWGTVEKSPEVHTRVWLLRLDEHGDTLWTRLYGEDGNAYVPSFVGETSDNGFIIAGTYDDWIMEDRFWLMKIDSTLELDWEKISGIPYVPPDTIVHTDGDTSIVKRVYPPRCVVETESGGFIVEGDRRYDEERTESHPIWFVEVSSTGKCLSYNNDSLLTQPLCDTNPTNSLILTYPTDDPNIYWSFASAYEDADSTQRCPNCIVFAKFRLINDYESVELTRRIYRLWDEAEEEFINETSDGGYIVVAWVRKYRNTD